jgi:hypothetical protein
MERPGYRLTVVRAVETDARRATEPEFDRVRHIALLPGTRPQDDERQLGPPSELQSGGRRNPDFWEFCDVVHGDGPGLGRNYRKTHHTKRSNRRCWSHGEVRVR